MRLKDKLFLTAILIAVWGAGFYGGRLYEGGPTERWCTPDLRELDKDPDVLMVLPKAGQWV